MHLADRPDRAGPADLDDRRPSTGRHGAPRRPGRPAPRARRGRPSTAWWTVAPSSSSRRTPGLGGSVGGPDRTRWTARPARAPAAAVSRAWFDQRRPDVTRLSAPSASGRADQELEVAQLVATERDRQEVLALDPQLGPVAERGRQPRQRSERRRPVEQRVAREPVRIGRPAGHAADGTRSYHRPMAVRVTPADRHTTIGQHPGMERSIAISQPTVGSTRLYSSIVSTAPGDRTRIHHHGDCETSIYIVSGSASYTFGPTGLEHALRGDDRRLRLHPGGRDPRRGQRVGDRAAGRRADPQLRRFARGLSRRRPRRRGRRPGTMLRH